MNNGNHSRAVIRLGGEASIDFLNGVVANDVTKAAADRAVFTALLTPQGKIQFEFFVFKTSDGVLLDVTAESADALIIRLKMYRLRAKVSIELAHDLAVVTSDAAFVGSVVEQSPDPRHPALGYRTIVKSESVVADPNYDQRRIAAGVPEFGRDFDADDVFLMDVNYDLLNGVSYAKGCFVGQEVTSRMKRKSAARKRTVIIESAEELTPGSDVMVGEARLGAVTSFEGRRGLALIRVDRLQETTEKVTVDAAEATLRLPEYLQDSSGAVDSPAS